MFLPFHFSCNIVDLIFVKTELFAQTFLRNFTLGNSRAILSLRFPSTHQDVISALSELSTKRADSADGISPVVFKTFGSEFISCLSKLFPLCLSTPAFPSYLKSTFIQPYWRMGKSSQKFNHWNAALFFLKFSNSLLTVKFRNILKLFLIPSARMASRKR